MTMSLDGFIEGANGAMDWMTQSDDHWRETFEVIDGADAFLVGAAMYSGYGKAWTASLTSPTASEEERAYARIAQRTKHYVVSRSMQSTPFFETSVLRDLDGVARLKEEPGKDIVAWGGGTLVCSLVVAGLVDELQLLVSPVVLGGGKALFGDVGAPARLKLAGAREYRSGVVLLRYEPKRG
jgi:dihydrofolate reductase